MEKPILELNDVKKQYRKKEVLKGISFSVYAGDIYAFIGPNGVGKTTTIKAITGLTRISSGTVTIGKNRRIGLILDQNCLYSFFTAKENMEYYLRLFGMNNDSTIDKYLKMVGLDNEKNVRVDKFSKGMKRRLVIARALAMKPEILIMDEPLDGLDVSSQVIVIRLLKEWVKQGERCILYTSHDMAEVENLCNRIGFIKDGKIALQGTMREVLQNEICTLRIVPRDNEDSVIASLADICPVYEKKEDELLFEADENTARLAIDALFDNNIRVNEYNLKYNSLTDIYERLNTDGKHN